MKNYYRGNKVKIFRCERCEKLHLHFRGMDIQLSDKELGFIANNFPKWNNHIESPILWTPFESITFYLNHSDYCELKDALNSTYFFQEVERILYEH
jgi:hypothetical protein